MRAAAISLIVLVFALLPSTARGQEGSARVSGFTTLLTGELTGKVTDADGDPLAGVEVHVISSSGEQVVVTNANGRYRVDLGQAAGQKTVFVRQVARINGESVVSGTLETGEEYFEILATEQPKVMPKATSGTNPTLEYSDLAKDRNVWARAWLLLEVDEEGKVRRLKLLQAPGNDLDEIALRAAVKLRFEPARNAAGKAIPALVLWTYEWPAYWWMIENKHVFGRVPNEAAEVPCAGSDRLADVYRDCTPAPIAEANHVEWIDPGTIAAALERPKDPAKYRHSRWYQTPLSWVLVGSGATLFAGGVYSLTSAQQYRKRADETMSPTRRAQLMDTADTRELGGYILGALGLGLSGLGVTRLIVQSDATSTMVSTWLTF